ncbi:DUF7825 domain-containing protein [Nonomuraea wenchangensis]|uniref:DUF7825 domain-containing protein n=1 Tax=Nonomuraea wenchangensis TaxID=568860 RepID=UPI003431F38E
MNPWREVLDRIEAGDDRDLATFLDGLSDLGRRAVAVQLHGHMAEELRGGFLARADIEGLATGFRLAGAACFTGAEQAAAWLDRRELRRPRDPELDTALLLPLLRRRPLEWRRELAVRLAARLRPATGRRRWQREEGVPGWDLVAALVADTGLEPPDGDAFVVGWVWRLARRWPREDLGLDRDPLLDALLPRLFQAQGVAEPLGRSTAMSELAALARTGRVPRATLVDGCASRFLAGGPDAEMMPFVWLWRLLAPEPQEVPVLDLVRLLPSAGASVAELAVEELRRAEEAGLLDDELFAEAVGVLAYRPEKKLVEEAVRWAARATGPRGGGTVPALAAVFDVDDPALRGRAVRLAVRLAPYAGEAGRDAVREAAARLPADLRERVAAGYGEVAGAEPEQPVAAVLRAPAPPALAPPIATPAELVAELRALDWRSEPARCERALGGLVELTHRDRAAVAAALRPWWEETLPDGAAAGLEPEEEPYLYGFGLSSYDRGIPSLVLHCALAVVAPAWSRRLARDHDSSEWACQRLVRRRLEEVIALFEDGRTVPALLATPTSATGHVDATVLVERLERLEGDEPLPADFEQALLRLPRRRDPELVVRAEKLPGEAGRTLAAWLRDGGWPDPVVRVTPYEDERSHDSYSPRSWSRRVRVEVVAPAGLPAWLAELWGVDQRGRAYLSSSEDALWGPLVLPSHRELVAAALVRFQPWVSDSNDARTTVLAALAHGDGPVGAATAMLIAGGLGHRRDAQRAAAAEAALTLAARGQLPAADLGRAVAQLVVAEFVVLKRITAALDDLTAAGAHAEMWAVLAEALPALLPRPGERPRAGLGELLAVAARAAALTGARGEVAGLAGMAARKGSSRVLYEARHLHETLTATSRTATSST